MTQSWTLALLALVAGIVTPPLWRIYELHGTEVLLQRFTSLSSSPSSSSLSSSTLAWSALEPPKTSAPVAAASRAAPRYSCSRDDLDGFLHDVPVAGMHLICLQPQTPPRGADDSGSNTVFNMTIYKGTSKGHVIEEAILIQDTGTPSSQSIPSWSIIKSILQSKLQPKPTDDLRQPWATFTPTGDRLLAEDDKPTASTGALFSTGMFLMIEGGQWVWPGVKKGFVREIRLDPDRNATLKTLSMHPLVFSVDGFLTPEECDWIQVKAAPMMKYSEVTLMDHDRGRPSSDFRTSQTAFLMVRQPELVDIDRRTALLVRIPESHQEPAQVLRYGHLEKYDTHHDYFDPTLYQNDPGTLRLIKNGRQNRMATVLWYLSDVDSGGETVFPRMDFGPEVSKETSCEVGLRVKPEKGKVVIFYSLTPDGSLDPLSLHGACPVREGIKWAANKWVWSGPLK